MIIFLALILFVLAGVLIATAITTAMEQDPAEPFDVRRFVNRMIYHLATLYSELCVILARAYEAIRTRLPVVEVN